MPRPKGSEYWEAGFDFEEEAKSILKAELKRNRLTYADLADRFIQFDQPMTEPTLRNKISRGSFSAAFFLECLALIGTESIHLASPLSQLGKMFAAAGERAAREKGDIGSRSHSFHIIPLIKAVRERIGSETGQAPGLKEVKDAVDETDLSSLSSGAATFEQAVRAVSDTLNRRSKSG